MVVVTNVRWRWAAVSLGVGGLLTLLGWVKYGYDPYTFSLILGSTLVVIGVVLLIRRAREWRPAAKNLLVALVVSASFVAYAAIAATLNGQPQTSTFPGWVTVLQDSNQPSGNEVGLVATLADPEGEPSHLEYDVVVCGNQPFRGILLIGGSAVLTDTRQFAQDRSGNIGPVPTSTVDQVPNFSADIGTDDIVIPALHLGAVQIFRFDAASVEPCDQHRAQKSGDQQFSGRYAAAIAGEAGAPVISGWNMAWWSGPRTRQTWPLVGGFPDDESRFLGPFQFSGIEGSWSNPELMHYTVLGGDLTPLASVDRAQPGLSNVNSLRWDGTEPMSPSARVSDIDAMNELQQWLVVTSIGLGVGASLLAALFFEWAQKPTQGNAALTEASTAASANSPPLRETNVGPLGTLAFVLALVLITRAARRHSRRRC
ncbi:hypothetical protein [Rhodococcus koreensis]|uniref:hypothetical protein n=1 Tax=Rhodococcus koreensis TaxID=99653 RepID=UPI00366F9F36